MHRLSEPVMPVTVATNRPSRRALAELLAEARARTLLLVSPLSNEAMSRRPDPAVNSVLAELERILRFEERWLLDTSRDSSINSYDEWFDSMMDVRQAVLDRVAEAVGEEDAGADALSLADRCRMVLEHEYQRGEAILETLQLQEEPYPASQQRTLPPGRRLADSGFMTRFAGGMVEIGATGELSVRPQEQPLHRVELEPFWIDLMPVTNGDFLTFIAAGGYAARELWSSEGWAWLDTSQARMPAQWSWRDGGWWSSWLGRDEPLDLNCPVPQVSYYEAEAFARFVEKRLPTEAEWEAAAGWDAEAQSRRHFPWGNMAPTPHVANLDQLAFRTAAVGAYPGNVSPVGCYGMIGDLWEWTAGCFLRGGSWATRPGAIHVSVRRPGSPQSRHMFSGFRCARNA